MINQRIIICVMIFFVGAIFSSIQAEAFIEGYAGVVGGSAKMSGEFINTGGVAGLTSTIRNKCSLGASAIGGGRVGGWLAQKNSCGAYDIFKNVGLYIDVNHHGLQSRNGKAQITYTDTLVVPTQQAEVIAVSKLKDSSFTTISFMLAYRHLFYGNDEFNCLEPYIAFGPAAMVIHNKVLVRPHEANDDNFTVMQNNISVWEAKKRTVPGFALDIGLRHVKSAHIFFDLFLKYRYARGNRSQELQDINRSLTYNLVSLQIGLGYTF